MDTFDVMFFCDMYARLGWSVQDQLQDIVGGEDLEEQNPNAMKEMLPFLRLLEKNGVTDAGEHVKNIEAYLKTV